MGKRRTSYGFAQILKENLHLKVRGEKVIVLKADSELKMTFERLIKTMHANVNWTGLFVALDNYLILQGEVRSLFFILTVEKWRKIL